MKPLALAITLSILTSVTYSELARQQFPMQTLDSMAGSVLKVSARACGDAARPESDRVATGFVWRDQGTAVTALHVISGCKTIDVYYQKAKISRSAEVLKVLRRADLALLSIKN